MRIDTVLPGDSVEFCPSATDVFVVGTYQLEEASPAPQIQPNNSDLDPEPSRARARRWGKCLVFKADGNNDQCTQLQEIIMPAVLDMKWSKAPSASDILAVADAEGHIALHRWQGNRLEHLQTLGCHGDDDLTDLICLSLDWAKNRSEQSSNKLSASLSNGSIVIASQSDAGMSITDTWFGHEFEPWVSAWDRWDQNFLYTGGDDCTLKGWDTRARPIQPAFINKRFDAGVTTIQSNPHSAHMLAVGSYDSTVRLFDMRQTSQIITQAHVGGGAWRVKWHPDVSRKQHLLVACMHDGFKVVDFGPQASHEPAWCILTQFDEHESLAYGADWSHAFPSEKGTLVASCSFYDHSLHLWRA
ncbi:WD40 repeat-like protein [Ramaria rubella]|nr:WD40 repeat-like protein [Ramaria rubella]